MKWITPWVLVWGCQEQELHALNIEPGPGVQLLAPGTDLVTDMFTVDDGFAVDVLFVVDDSGSMDDDQHRLAANVPAFLARLQQSGADYHLGVTTTTTDAGAAGVLQAAEGHRWIEPHTPHADALVATLALVGTDGSDSERGREAAWAALELRRDSENAGFLRDDSDLHVVVVSDENDSSDQVSPLEFATLLLDRQAAGRRATFSSVVHLPLDVSDCSISMYATGYAYMDLTERVGGAVLDICDADWAAGLDELGSLVSARVEPFHLHQRPDPATVQVWTLHAGARVLATAGRLEQGRVVDGDYAYTPIDNAVWLTIPPEHGPDQVEITYVTEVAPG